LTDIIAKTPQIILYVLQLALTLFSTSSFLSTQGRHYSTTICDDNSSGQDTLLAYLGYVDLSRAVLILDVEPLPYSRYLG
jgi:hypothetical protein